MVHISYPNASRTIEHLISRLPQDKGYSLVYSPNSMYFYIGNIHILSDTYRSKKAVSIVICTYGRPESLSATLTSLSNQTFKDFEILLITEKGNLSELRHKGLVHSIGDIVSFIDDDVYCEPTWLESVTKAFRQDSKVLGVTGPTTITDEYKKNRDIFKFRLLRAIHDRIFLGKLRNYPSHLSRCGCPSMESNNAEITYAGKCDYLEACNMSVKKKEALDEGGFDSVYFRTSEWCELDLALKIGRKGTLLFVPEARLFHRPSKQGIYRARLSTSHRWANFKSFQRRWVKPSNLRNLYWAWVWMYLKMKEMRMI